MDAVREVHPEKARSPMEVMESGISTVVRLTHPSKREFAMEV